MLQLKKFHDIPDSTREEARESRPHPEEPRFSPLALEEGSFPCVVGKEFPAFCRISRGGALHRKGERNSRVVPPFPESPRCSVHNRETSFPALPRLSSRGSTHTTVARGTDLWESLVGKPHGKTSRESHRFLYPRERISQSISGKPVFPALPRLSSRGSTHNTVARGTALWESLVGKPCWKASWESLEGKPLIP